MHLHFPDNGKLYISRAGKTMVKCSREFSLQNCQELFQTNWFHTPNNPKKSVEIMKIVLLRMKKIRKGTIESYR